MAADERPAAAARIAPSPPATAEKAENVKPRAAAALFFFHDLPRGPCYMLYILPFLLIFYPRACAMYKTPFHV